MSQIRSILPLLPLVAASFAGAAPALAMPVTTEVAITNATFSDPVLLTGAYHAGVPGWTASQTTNPGMSGFAGVSHEPVIPTVGGPNFALVNNFTAVTTGISQQLSAKVQDGTTYDLSAYFGWRNDNDQSVGGLQLWAGGTATGGTVTGGTLLASTLVTLSKGKFVEGQLVYTTSGSEPTAGERLSIVLTGAPLKNSFAQTDFDDVTLTATVQVPEPASITVLAGGLLLIAGGRRART